MAVVADIDSIDLVVEPHELTPEDREVFRRTIQECRAQAGEQLSEKAARLLARRRAASMPKRNATN